MTNDEKLRAIEANLGIKDLTISTWGMGSFLSPTTIKVGFTIIATDTKASVTASDLEDLVIQIRKVIRRAVVKKNCSPFPLMVDGKPTGVGRHGAAYLAHTGERWYYDATAGHWTKIDPKAYAPLLPIVEPATKPTKPVPPKNPWARKLIL